MTQLEPILHVKTLQPRYNFGQMEVCQLREGSSIYFLTFTVVEWLPVFIAAEPCSIVAKSLNFCHQYKGLRINAFVIMPTHIYLILFDVDHDVANLRNSLRDMRQFTGRKLADYCDQHLPQPFRKTIHGTVRTDRVRQFWQQSRKPVAIWTEKFWRTKQRYIHDNPRRKGLVREGTEWRYSSAAFWLLEPSGESDVVLTGIEWL